MTSTIATIFKYINFQYRCSAKKAKYENIH